MRLIVLETLTIKAFRCFTAEVTIEFPPEGGLRFLTGRNQVEPSLGSNGSGKSSLWDALVWCQYGTSIRGERAADLASWGLQQRPHVIATYDIDGETHTIDRTGSPDALLLDGKIVPQSAIDSLMGLNRARFVQSVIFGQAAPLFMDLPIPERGELLDQVMDLSMWMRMSGFAGDRSAEMLRAISELEKTHAGEVGRLTALNEQQQTMMEDEARWHYAHQQTLSAAQDAYTKADAELRNVEQQARAVEREIPGPETMTELAANVREAHEILNHVVAERAKLNERRKRAQQDHFFLRDHSTCPTCAQRIGATFKQQRFAALDAQIAEADTGRDQLAEDEVDAIKLLEQTQAELDEMTEQRAVIGERLSGLRAEVAARQRELAQARQVLAQRRQEGKENPVTARLTDLRHNIEILQVGADELQTALEDTKADQIKVDYWKRGFRQVRLFLIRRILAMLEIETAAAASVLGIGNWKITFATEVETRSGTTRPGIHINAVNPQEHGQYKSYSFGEAQRIKLAVSMGLASLIQSMSGVYYGLEVFDEPTAWLSPEGIDDLLGCLQARADSTGRTVWLVDHRSLDYPFDGVWLATKTASGTELEVLR